MSNKHLCLCPCDLRPLLAVEANFGKLSLCTGTGWRAFFDFCVRPPGPYDFPGKIIERG